MFTAYICWLIFITAVFVVIIDVVIWAVIKTYLYICSPCDELCIRLCIITTERGSASCNPKHAEVAMQAGWRERKMRDEGWMLHLCVLDGFKWECHSVMHCRKVSWFNQICPPSLNIVLLVEACNLLLMVCSFILWFSLHCNKNSNSLNVRTLPLLLFLLLLSLLLNIMHTACLKMELRENCIENWRFMRS